MIINIIHVTKSELRPAVKNLCANKKWASYTSVKMSILEVLISICIHFYRTELTDAVSILKSLPFVHERARSVQQSCGRMSGSGGDKVGGGERAASLQHHGQRMIGASSIPEVTDRVHLERCADHKHL